MWIPFFIDIRELFAKYFSSIYTEIREMAQKMAATECALIVRSVEGQVVEMSITCLGTVVRSA